MSLSIIYDGGKKGGGGIMKRNSENENSVERKQHPVKECVMRNEPSAASGFLKSLKENFTHESMVHIRLG